MKFSEWINKNCQDINDFEVVDIIDTLLKEYNEYLKEEVKKSITSEFLIGLGFKLQFGFFIKEKRDKAISISFDSQYAGISNESINIELEIPFPKTQKDVLDLMRLLDVD